MGAELKGGIRMQRKVVFKDQESLWDMLIARIFGKVKMYRIFTTRDGVHFAAANEENMITRR